MASRSALFANDNIRTGHLKCDHCRTRVHLKRIEQLDGCESRSFECSHCGAVKSLQITTVVAAAAPVFNRRSTDRSGC